VRIGISSQDTNDHTVKYIRKTLEEVGISTFQVGTKSTKDVDCILVLGGDRAVRNYFHHVLDSEVPVLGITESESTGFLAQMDLKELSSFVKRIKSSDYIVEKVSRLGVKIDGKFIYPVLNDLAIFSSKSALLMEHVLRVDGEEVWHDSSDGVILSTPIGSSAYSMSAGGPVIFQDSGVFGIISVNSLDVTRRPLVVPDSTCIEIDDISSRLHCEAIFDGKERFKVKKIVNCSKFEVPAHIIRVKKDSTAVSALAKKVHLAEELLNMPPSSKLLLKTLEYEGALTQKELSKKTLLPDRTVRLALSHLLDKGHVKKKISIRDARQRIYEIPK